MERRTSRSGDFLHRGHSDGDVLSSGRHTHNERLLEQDRAWIEFLRQSGSDRSQEPVQIAARRAAMMAADRRRRLTDQGMDGTRRRSSSNILLGQHSSGRTRPSMPYPANDHTMPQIPAHEGTERRLPGTAFPRRTSAAAHHPRSSREVTLPRWQPDGEVTKCPICGTNFSFWYRKHHCRTCGRVVCANCSPHRITIPRQYIVRSPEQSRPTISGGRGSGIEVVDLTEENEEDTAATRQTPGRRDRPQSRDYRIDPALGGGQEVRLCNPCVPDPNPLPHLYPSNARFSFDSAPRPENTPQNPYSSIARPRDSSVQHHLQQQPGITASQSNLQDVHGNLVPQVSFWA